MTVLAYFLKIILEKKAVLQAVYWILICREQPQSQVRSALDRGPAEISLLLLSIISSFSSCFPQWKKHYQIRKSFSVCHCYLHLSLTCVPADARSPSSPPHQQLLDPRGAAAASTTSSRTVEKELPMDLPGMRLTETNNWDMSCWCFEQ